MYMYILHVIHKFISVEIIENVMFLIQDFYSVLGVSKDANKSEIKSGKYASDRFLCYCDTFFLSVSC